MVKISTSILGCENIIDSICKVNESITDYLHLDVMNNTITSTTSYEDITNIKEYNKKPLDIHLMVSNPSTLVDKYISLNPKYLTVHVEIKENIKELINYIKNKNIQVGLSIQVDTNIDSLLPYLNYIDLILIMGVPIGKSGQYFEPDTITKIGVLNRLRTDNNYNYEISVDGGIDSVISKSLSDIDIIVSGSYIMNGEDINEQINRLKDND